MTGKGKIEIIAVDSKDMDEFRDKVTEIMLDYMEKRFKKQQDNKISQRADKN